MVWKIQLAGREADLRLLANSFIHSDCTILREEQGYVLTSSKFANETDAEIVRGIAKSMVDALNGGCRLAFERMEPVIVGAVCMLRSDGAWAVIPAGLIQHLGLHDNTAVSHRDCNGIVAEINPADSVRNWVTLAFADPAISQVLQVLSSSEADWVNLYRVYEIVEFDVGSQDAIVANGWASKASMRLFKHTACSPGAVGVEAGHGVDHSSPPRVPMLIAEARAMITAIVHAWLRDKLAATDQP